MGHVAVKTILAVAVSLASVLSMSVHFVGAASASTEPRAKDAYGARQLERAHTLSRSNGRAHVADAQTLRTGAARTKRIEATRATVEQRIGKFMRFRADSAGATRLAAGYSNAGQAGGVMASAGPAICNGRRATIVGTQGDDVIYGTPGRDVIAGLGGNDEIHGRGQNDIICGGPGDDFI